MTYESICKKLGFDPVADQDKMNKQIRQSFKGYEDDSRKNPFSVLTKEESDFLLPFILKEDN